MLKRDGSVPIERMTSLHTPLGIKNTKDEHEAPQAPSRGHMGFPWKGKYFPIKVRRKEREAREASAAADRLRHIEETMKRQQDQINELSQQGTAGLSQQHVVQAAVDATDPSYRKSSVASSMVPAGDDDALMTDPLRRYPVDAITESTPCELHVKVFNLTMKVAVGYAVPIGPTPTFHCSQFLMATLLSGWKK